MKEINIFRLLSRFLSSDLIAKIGGITSSRK